MQSVAGLSAEPTISEDSRALPLVVNCSAHAHVGGFFEPLLSDRLRWLHVSTTQPVSLPFWGRKGQITRIAGAHRAARAAAELNASIAVSHDPRVSFTLQHCLRLNGYRGPHLAFAFNYSTLPTAWQTALHRSGFHGIDRFVVYSQMERRLYHEVFGIPLEKLEFLHWGVAPPIIDPIERPLVEGDYCCAIGGNSRDYKTFVDAVRQLPDMRVVLVVRPENVAKMELPSNVQVMTNIPFAHAMNVLAFSRFTAVPLTGPDVACGHVTLVNAMKLGKAIAITRSSGVTDYARDEENALMFSAKSVVEMTGVLRRMWEDPALCERLGKNGMAFADEYCTEERTLAEFTRILCELGVPA